MKGNRIIFIFIMALSITPMNGQNTENQKITYTPVGVFHTDYTPLTGAPRQGILAPEGKGRIEIYPEFHGALKALELFEYIIVIYHFDQAVSWHALARPPESNPEFTFGLFATRSPNRPNPIGIATLKLEKVDNGILYVSGVDAFNGTPVLDIKPYLPSIDGVKSTRNELAEKELGLHGDDINGPPSLNNK